jgi:hypothetical protein
MIATERSGINNVNIIFYSLNKLQGSVTQYLIKNSFLIEYKKWFYFYIYQPGYSTLILFSNAQTNISTIHKIFIL